ncbi:MAG: SulP family inorganic anion transporter [Flavobacteriaceae bacterium]
MKNFIPILKWLPNYKKKNLYYDFFAGINVGILLVPQGMAYALIAGLPPIYGLYAALTPQIVYAILGTSRQLAVGPVAIDSLIVASGLGIISVSSPEQYILMAISLAFIVGSFQIIMALFKFSFIAIFLSKPIINGFVSALAIIIGFSQLKYLLGISLSKTSLIQNILIDIYNNINQINLPTLYLGLSSILIILLVKKYRPKFPIYFTILILGTFFSYVFNLSEKGIAVVENIPKGLPEFNLPLLNYDVFIDLFKIAITLAILGYIHAISIAKKLEEKHNYYKIDPNQELLALGMSNIIGSFFQSYPVSGGLSRSAVNDESGAKSGISAIISASIVAVIIIFFTSYLYHLPKTILSSIIIVAVINLIDYKFPKKLFLNFKDEFFLLIITFFTTIFFGIIEGIILGLFISFVIIPLRLNKPGLSINYKIKYLLNSKSIVSMSEKKIKKSNILILELKGQLFFGNLNYLKSFINKQNINNSFFKTLILDIEKLYHIDNSGIESLYQIINTLKNKKIRIIISGFNKSKKGFKFEKNLIRSIKKKNIFVSIDKVLDQLNV